MDVSPLNLGMIAAYYNISYVTVEVYTLSLKERTKMKGLLEVVSSSAELKVYRFGGMKINFFAEYTTAYLLKQTTLILSSRTSKPSFSSKHTSRPSV